MKIKIVVGVLFFYLSSWALNFSIAPTGFELDLDKVNVEEVYLMNNTATPLRIETYLEEARGYEGRNLNEEIVVFPRKVSIRPGGRQIIRFKVKNSEKKSGRYKSLIVFREIPSQIKKEKKLGRGSDFGTNLDFVTEIAIGVVGEKRGEIE